ncbi:MAG TPA: RimK domain-containing protein ATP-grasp [Blastocatellia bacterium]|nr:RimK domain-containing protein ATP-grasp [Blastocatellia bacterium]
MILLCGVMTEGPMSAVYEALVRIGGCVAVYDQRDVLETEVALAVDSEVTGELRTRGERIDLNAVSAAYMRLYDSRQIPAVARTPEESAERNHAVNVDDCLLSWADLTAATVVNRPSAMASNNSKPFQAELIRAFGFDVPETLITTDPEAAREFHTNHRDLIYKSISGVRSVVSRLGREDLDRLDDLVWCPTQFQQYVCGADYRVHVVGDEVFACQITSDADDYRYASRQGADVDMETCNLPPELADRCRALVAAMDLSFGGVDLRESPDGRWYCFEVNPSPAFTYYQSRSGQPIDEAVARLLSSAHNTNLKTPGHSHAEGVVKTSQSDSAASLCHP